MMILKLKTFKIKNYHNLREYNKLNPKSLSKIVDYINILNYKLMRVQAPQPTSPEKRFTPFFFGDFFFNGKTFKGFHRCPFLKGHRPQPTASEKRFAPFFFGDFF